MAHSLSTCVSGTQDGKLPKLAAVDVDQLLSAKVVTAVQLQRVKRGESGERTGEGAGTTWTAVLKLDLLPEAIL